MKKRKEIAHVQIHVYDEDGGCVRATHGPMSYDDLKANMLAALEHDGIPVVRQLAKHEAEEATEPDVKLLNLPKINMPLPLSLRWEYQGVIFSATGTYDDVMSAQEEFLNSMFEEDE